jgi:hypothetical protein
MMRLAILSQPSAHPIQMDICIPLIRCWLAEGDCFLEGQTRLRWGLYLIGWLSACGSVFGQERNPGSWVYAMRS